MVSLWEPILAIVAKELGCCIVVDSVKSELVNQ